VALFLNSKIKLALIREVVYRGRGVSIINEKGVGGSETRRNK
jgi:hypothetical protein